jgi:hypothetical protein
MFNKKRKRKSFLFTASMLGAGVAAYYLTKEATQGEDRNNGVNTYSSDYPIDFNLNDLI